MILDADKFAEEDKAIKYDDSPPSPQAIQVKSAIAPMKKIARDAAPVEKEATGIKPDFRGIVLGFKSNGVMTDKIIDYTSEVGVDEIKSRQNTNFNGM